MKTFKFLLNDKTIVTKKHPGTTLLDFIRNEKCLKGTNEACREGECGACTVLISDNNSKELKYKAVTSCILPLGYVQNRHVVTIEGLNFESGLNTIQQALVDFGATQCGFCTPGFVLSLTGFFMNSEKLSYSDAIDSMDGNICRCTGYVSIEKSAKFLSDKFSQKLDNNNKRITQLVNWKIVPEYFSSIESKLKKLNSEDPLENFPGKAEVIVAGGTDLYVQGPDELAEKKINFLSNNKELSEIKKDKNYISIGGAVTIEQLKKSKVCIDNFPGLENYINLISSTVLRNSATAAGNIINASPIADMAIMLLPMDCILHLNNGKKQREVALNNFYKDYKIIDLKKNEILEWIKVPILKKKYYYNFEKISKRKFLDIASVNSAICLKVENDKIIDVVISAGGVAPVPCLLSKTSEFLKNKEIQSTNIIDAANVASSETAPISDIRGTKEYKSLLLRQLIYSHFIKLFPDKIKFEELL